MSRPRGRPLWWSEPAARPFLVLWLGQLVSIVGSGLSGFALGVWIFQDSGSVTRFTLVFLAVTLPSVIVAPLAGTVVDRLPRRRVMMLADLSAGLATLGLLLLLSAGRLEFGWILLATVVTSTATAFQVPAQQAAISLLVPPENLSRAAGMLNLATSASQIGAPVLAGILLERVGLHWVLGLDLVTFLFAIGCLASVSVPELGDRPESKSLAEDLRSGWRYLRSSLPLWHLLRFEIWLRFRVGVAHILTTPLVLAFGTAETLGFVLAAGGAGMVVGSLVAVTWGGPSRHMDGVLLFQALGGACLLAACLRPDAWLVAAGVFAYSVCLPISGSCSQAIWQGKVDPPFQGRVFALRRMIGWSGLPLAYLVAGPLSDRILEPWMAVDGLLAGSVGTLIGTGPGRGVAFLYGLMGLYAVLLMTFGFLNPRLRYLEDELPDRREPAPPASTSRSS